MTPLPDGPRPSTGGRLLRRALRVLNAPAARLALTLLAVLALAAILGS